MKVNDKRVVDGAGYIDLGKFVDSHVTLNGGASIEMNMGYDILVESDELEKLINLLERIETIRDGKLNDRS